MSHLHYLLTGHREVWRVTCDVWRLTQFRWIISPGNDLLPLTLISLITLLQAEAKYNSQDNRDEQQIRAESPNMNMWNEKQERISLYSIEVDNIPYFEIERAQSFKATI